jgi:hypothetical protein
MGAYYRTRTDLHTRQDHSPRTDVGGSVDPNSSNSCRIEKLIHLRIMSHDYTTLTKSTVIIDANQVTVANIDPGGGGKQHVASDMHTQVPQSRPASFGTNPL